MAVSLQRRGLHLRTAWEEKALAHLRSSGGATDDATLEVRLYELFLASDLCESGESQLPHQTAKLRRMRLKGGHLLQVNELLNVGSTAEHRGKDNASRCLKLHLTDGKQSLVGVEVKMIKDLSVQSAPGVKLFVRDVKVRHGMLMLYPENTAVLGGAVGDLRKYQQAAHEAGKRMHDRHLDRVLNIRSAPRPGRGPGPAPAPGPGPRPRRGPKPEEVVEPAARGPVGGAAPAAAARRGPARTGGARPPRQRDDDGMEEAYEGMLEDQRAEDELLWSYEEQLQRAEPREAAAAVAGRTRGRARQPGRAAGRPAEAEPSSERTERPRKRIGLDPPEPPKAPPPLPLLREWLAAPAETAGPIFIQGHMVTLLGNFASKKGKSLMRGVVSDGSTQVQVLLAQELCTAQIGMSGAAVKKAFKSDPKGMMQRLQRFVRYCSQMMGTMELRRRAPDGLSAATVELVSCRPATTADVQQLLQTARALQQAVHVAPDT